MKHINLLIITILTTISVQYVFTQNTPEEITSIFFEKYEKEGPAKALEYVFSTNPWMENQKDATLQINSKLSQAVSLIGEYYGYELITIKSVGESYKMYSYMLKYSRQPIQFTFILYKPKDKWQIQNLKFDDQLIDDLEEQENLLKNKR
ncbi:MAG: hypothetical protein Kow0068_26120 [Marinilabiliales bacterium]